MNLRPLPDLFYRSLTERQRGSRIKVQEQLQRLLPFVLPLSVLGSPPKALDLESGRGEWAQIIRDAGFEVTGIDGDPVNVATCQMYGLEVRLGEALDALNVLPENSLALVSAFGLVDRLSLDQVRILSREALRVLVPGGIFILGANNPEYAALGVFGHAPKIQPDLLDYVLEYEGFERHLIARMLDYPSSNLGSKWNLRDTLSSELAIYAVVAQKAAPQNILGQFDTVFDGRYGLSLQELAMRYLQEQDQQLALINERTQQLDSRIWHEAERMNTALGAITNKAENEAERMNAALGAITTQLNSIRYFIKVVARIEAGLRFLVRPFLRHTSFWQLYRAHARFYCVNFLKKTGLHPVAKKLYLSLKTQNLYGIKNLPVLDEKVAVDEKLSARAFEISKRLKIALKKRLKDIE